MNSSNALSPDERRFVREAAEYLEAPSFLMRAATMVGKPAEAMLTVLPDRAQQLGAQGTSAALRRGLEWAIAAVPVASPVAAGVAGRKPTGWLAQHRHTAVAALAGAGGGFFGVAGLPVELPATTMVMLHSIASIAASHGADLDDPSTRLDCLAVLSFGSERLEEMESAYFTTRVGLAMAMQQASAFLAKHTAREVSEALARGTAPMLLRFIGTVASRFQVTVTQKVAAQSVPLAGAALGAVINAAFTDHFNRVAHYHFGLLQLERCHGREAIEVAYRAAQRAYVDRG